MIAKLCVRKCARVFIQGLLSIIARVYEYVGSVRARQLVYECVSSVRARQLVYECVGSVRARQLVYECVGSCASCM